ncbi:hypothetical protein SDRG_07105 [Saprolegnia diclina VS20]|uniref:Uncharacterized protein n=1 Tax=Saprolegnia diclina (strain VS20) TaxID=1156394 RepID=T0QNJ3_SAPDV|nr:hypothetical protein SDRG_07105 [Saprolegnia diclina VS20]EQC35395.1 hypothetical protein SDRG_07105 [Saprolegnia diclina VS20]|eukprot:XP_008611145.1 hypothetical protein SDRG_07105 [Saprolegnia diclina VS20]
MGPCASKDRDLGQWATNGAAEASAHVDEKPEAVLLQRAEIPATSVVDLSPAFPSLIATAWDDGSIVILDWQMRKVLLTLSAHAKAVNRLSFGPKTRSLYACSRDTTISQHVLSSSDAPTAPQSFTGHTLSVSALAINAAESNLASGSRDTGTSLWDVTTRARVQHTTTSQNIVTCMTWVPQCETLLAQGGEDLCVRLWDTRSWKSPAQTIQGYVYFPLSIDASDDGNYLLTSSKGFNGVGCEGRVWDRRTGKLVTEMHGHLQDASACAYMRHKNAYAVTASKDSSLRIWNSASGELITSSFDHSSGMFTSVACRSVETSDEVTVFTTSFAGHVSAYTFNTATLAIDVAVDD